ncbi:MAG TPA: 3-deoxy-7-phosphoheptulonate synthase class II [Actinomycetota bacterium]|nr:3-deoxy-7-phosphoheptulonate synthase class II [Actinomycetota bacterium]
MQTTWSPSSWRDKDAAQQPDWSDADLELALVEIRRMLPLVFAGEARALTTALAQAGEGNAFVLQAGDCAESFNAFSPDLIRDQLKVILQMAVVLTYAGGLPVIKVGRIAGQFAKPRSSPNEMIDGLSLPSFRGHSVNGPEFDAESRRPDPNRLIRAYHQASATLNLIRAFTKGGFADIGQMHVWNQEFVASSRQGQQYEAIVRQISMALRFMEACGIDLRNDSHLHQVDFYTSHEALILGFEEALTRQDSLTGDWYDCSAHMLWAGERTRQPDGAHIEFLSGIHNPIGVKVGPGTTPDELVELCERLNVNRDPGRLTIIPRLGSDLVEEKLPPLVQAVKKSGIPVVWVCDPMHGNTFTTLGGVKTRRFDQILTEIKGFFAVHQQEGTVPGGVHLELTPDAVTECLGGVEEVLEDHLQDRNSYQTLCDPRLNARQSLDLVFEIASLLQSG